MSNNALLGGLFGLGGAIAYDKFFNDGELTDKVTDTIQSGGFSQSIKETITGGSDIIREVITNNTILEKVSDVGILDNVKDTLSGGFSAVVDSGADIIDNINNGLPSVPNPLSGYASFKEGGGVLGQVSGVVGLGWLSSNINKAFSGAVDISQDFYSGAYNIGTLVNGAVTGQEYENRMVGGNLLRYPVEENTGFKSSSSSSKKRSSSSSSGSSKKRSSSSSSGSSFISSLTRGKVATSTPSNANFSSNTGASVYKAPPKSSGYKAKKKINDIVRFR